MRVISNPLTISIILLIYILIPNSSCQPAPNAASGAASVEPIRISSDSYTDWVYIDKSTNKNVYNKNENISVTLKIFATRFEPNIIIRDDIPEEFQYIETPSIGYNSYYDKVSNQIIFRNIRLASNQNRNPTIITYKIKTQKSNTYSLGTPSLVFEGNTYLFPSPEIEVRNRPPNLIIENYPKLKSWEGETNQFSAMVNDPDNDSVTCNLYLDRVSIIKPKYSNNNSSEMIYYKYIWDLSTVGPGSHTLYLKASDGEDTTRTEDLMITIDKRLFGKLPIPDYILASMATLLGTLILIFRENIRDLFWKSNPKKGGSNFNRLNELKEMLDSGLITEDEYIRKKKDILAKL